MRTLFVRLLKTHFLHPSLIVKSQQNRIKLLSRPDIAALARLRTSTPPVFTITKIPHCKVCHAKSRDLRPLPEWTSQNCSCFWLLRCFCYVTSDKKSCSSSTYLHTVRQLNTRTFKKDCLLLAQIYITKRWGPFLWGFPMHLFLCWHKRPPLLGWKSNE